METACLGPAIASLAFWALIVAEVRIPNGLNLLFPLGKMVQDILDAPICGIVLLRKETCPRWDATVEWEWTGMEGRFIYYLPCFLQPW